VSERKQSFTVDTDEHPRETTLEKLAALKPAFSKEGSVTAGNSSGINDGSAALLLAGEDAVKQFNLTLVWMLRSWVSVRCLPHKRH
jgi:acetyl-CoA acetyltransferase